MHFYVGILTVFEFVHILPNLGYDHVCTRFSTIILIIHRRNHIATSLTLAFSTKTSLRLLTPNKPLFLGALFGNKDEARCMRPQQQRSAHFRCQTDLQSISGCLDGTYLDSLTNKRCVALASDEYMERAKIQKCYAVRACCVEWM